MSKINELIAKLCPDGVPAYVLKDVFELRNGYTPAKSNSEFWTNGSVPWFRMEDIQKNGRILDSGIQSVHVSALKGAGKYEADSIIMSTSATIGEHALITIPFLANQRFTVLTRKPEYKAMLMPKFTYYLMFGLADFCRENTTMSSFAGVEMSKFREYKIQIPPLEIQNEIVKILDTFTQLEAELEAELEARRFQQKLIVDKFHRSELWELKDFGEYTLRELVDFENGKPHEPLVDENGDCKLITSKFISSNGTLARRIFRNDIRTLAQVEDITIVLSDLPNGRALAKCYFVKESDTYAVNQRIAILRSKDPSKIDPAYIYHYVNRNPQILKYDDGSTQTHLKKDNVLDTLVRLPDIESQRHIANVLSMLQTFVQSASDSLPAEIAARRQQYEYYRNKLLTFKELKAS